MVRALLRGCDGTENNDKKAKNILPTFVFSHVITTTAGSSCVLEPDCRFVLELSSYALGRIFYCIFWVGIDYRRNSDRNEILRELTLSDKVEG